jgi:Fe-S oxidoreductase
MLSGTEKLLFLITFLLSVILSYYTFSRMIRIIGRGAGGLHFDHPGRRLGQAVSVLLTQRTVFTDRLLLSIFHAVIAWAFMLYAFVNLGDILEGYIAGFHFLGDGLIGNLYRVFVDGFSLLAVVSMTVFLIRRFLTGAPKLNFSEQVALMPEVREGIRRDSLIVGFFIILHVGFRLLGDSFSLAQHGTDMWQPVASWISRLWSGLSPDAISLFRHICWWIAIGLILLFIPYFPLSKHAHLFMGPFNYLTRPERSAPGTLERLDFEAEDTEQFGVARLEHLDRTSLIDAYACIMCNRCQDVCPAYLTGKELSPSALEINKRYYMNRNAGQLAGGKESAQPLVGFALSESAVWACTSCAACVEICPVGNEPMYDILNIRRDRVLMEAKFPAQLENAFNGMERNGNPWNMNKDRMEWAKEDPPLRVKSIDENPGFDILYWVGCAGAFDQRGQKIARAFTKILNHAGVNFAILGNKENCTGDSARRTGNEYLFAMMAEKNVETLNAAGAKKIVTTCPHCLQTLKNEYPQFGGNYEVVHHTQFIESLFSEGKIRLNTNNGIKLTFHDPCYLGRHNGIFESPRNALHSAGMTVLEMERSRNRSFCCGAGGGNMWKEEEEGKDAVRRERFREAENTGSPVLGTGCPFCLTMLRDAGNELGSELTVRDIGEIIADGLQD